MLLIFMLINFSPLTELVLFVPFEEDLVFFSLLRGQIYFDFPSLTGRQRKNRKKLKKRFGQIQVHLEFCTASYMVSVM